MIHTARLVAFHLLLASPFALHAADRGLVIERAPESSTPSQAELDALRAENRQLAAELDSTRHAVARLTADLAAKTQNETAFADTTRELATLRAKLARLEAAPSADTEKKRADEATARLATLVEGASRLQEEKVSLETQLADTRKAEATLREQLAAASTVAASTEQTRAASELQSVRQEKSALEAQLTQARETEASLRGQLAAKPAATDSPPISVPTPAPENSARLAELENKLTTVLRSYSLTQAENEKLKSATAENERLTAEAQTLRDEKTALESRLSAATAGEPSPELAAKLAETENKLTTTLRSFSLLQAENDRLQSASANAAESARTSAAQSSGESAAQISALFNDLRQTKAQVVALSAENSQLKTRLALSGPAPGTTLSSPSRPGTLIPESVASEATPLPAAPGRTHTVVLGDTLGKISRQYYGTPNRWQEILQANRDVVQNENSLPTGVTLRIP